MSQEPEHLDAGATVGRYLILDVLGSGGMSVVYGAYDPQLDRRVALKLMRAADDGRDRNHVRDRLLREAQALARLAHPNVVTVHDVGTVGDQVFVAMEYVEGRTLSTWLDDEPSRSDVLRVFRHAGDGLAAAHAVGLVHRDFKPENVMIDARGRVRVMDFGLARPSGSPSSEAPFDSDAAVLQTSSSVEQRFISADALGVPLTVTGAVMGTPAYMAPEQHSGGRTGPSTDQFAFCVALYEALYGERPFAGRSRADLRANVLHGRVRDPPSGRRVPRRLRRALLRGLSVHPMHRWPSMSALLGELERVPRSRRRGLLVVTALAIGGTGVALASTANLSEANAIQACTEAVELGPTWDADRRQALDERYTEDVAPWVREAWPGVAAHLDDYAARWVEARRLACGMGDAAEGEAPPWTRCLDEERERLHEVVLTLEQGSPLALQRAHEQLEALPDPRDCVGPSEAAGSGAAPGDDGARRRASALRRRLVVLRVELASTPPRARSSDTEELLEEARSLGDRALEAEASLVRGLALENDLRAAEARVAFEGAWRQALASGRDALAFEAAVALARVTTADGRPDDALGWARNAAALVARDDRGPLDRAALLVVEARARARRGEHEVARAQLEEAQQLRVAALGEDAPAVAEILLLRGQLERDAGRLAEALELLEHGRERLVAGLGEGHPQVARADLLRAGVLIDDGRGTAARAVLERARSSLEQAMGADDPAMAESLVIIGQHWATLGEPSRADEALTLADVLVRTQLGEQHPRRVEGLMVHAAVLRDRGEPGEAEPRLLLAVRVAEAAHGGKSPRVARALVALGEIRLRQGAFDEAVALAERAVAIERAQPTRAVTLGAALLVEAGARIELGQAARALGALDEAVAIVDEPGAATRLRARAHWLRGRALAQTQAPLDEARREVELAATQLRDARGDDAGLGQELDAWLAAHPSG